MKVFLGGTCNNSTWRQYFEQRLTIDYFNPVVDDWNEECYLRELQERADADFCLYVLTPLMVGVYSIAEVVDDSNKRPEKTVFCFLNDDIVFGTGEQIHFSVAQDKSLKAVGKMVERNGGKWFETLEECVEFLNGQKDA